MDQHFLHSSYREKLIEHLFVGELLKLSWLKHSCKLEIAKPEVDNSGYDLIAEEGGVVRHIQLKASHAEARAAYQKVHIALGQKPSGCVVWVVFNESTLSLGPYLFFGAAPGDPLPELASFRVAKHTKGNAEGVKKERPTIRDIPKSQFKVYESGEAIYEALFGRI